jgi:mRNA degradation ribonuclease J1/J2
VALLPIGDNYTMGPDDALRAVQFLNPRLVVPVHYGTFDVIQQDPHAFADRVKQTTGIDVVVMSPGESLHLLKYERGAKVVATSTPLLERRRKISSVYIILPRYGLFSNGPYIRGQMGSTTRHRRQLEI